VVTAEQVRERLAGGTDYAAAARALGVPPGLAYLVATGLPADGSAALTEADLARPGVLAGSTQHLTNPRLETRDAGRTVSAWMRTRARGGDG
jgi:hypothetical protein